MRAKFLARPVGRTLDDRLSLQATEPIHPAVLHTRRHVDTATVPIEDVCLRVDADHVDTVRGHGGGDALTALAGGGGAVKGEHLTCLSLLLPPS